MPRVVVAFLAITAIAFGSLTPLTATATPSSATVDCNQPTSQPIAWVDLPSTHAFQALPSKDGCWIFVSLATGNGEAGDSDPAAKIAIFARKAGRISLSRVVHVGGNPNGMVLTHDGTMLVLADGNRVAAYFRTWKSRFGILERRH